MVVGLVEDHVDTTPDLGGESHVWTFATTQVYVEESGRLLYLAGHTGPVA